MESQRQRSLSEEHVASDDWDLDADLPLRLKAIEARLAADGIADPLLELADCQEIVQGVVKGTVVFASQEQKDYFLRVFLPTAIKHIMRRKYVMDESVDAVNAIICSCLQLFIQVLPDDVQELLEWMPAVIDPTQVFYKNHGVDVKSEHSLEEDIEEATAEWRKSIGFGEWIDAVKVDAYTGKKSWSRAIIAQDNENTVKLTFENCPEIYDRWVSRNSLEIAPKGCKTKVENKDDSWRSKLMKGSLIDALDTNKVWTNSTVLDTRSSCDYPRGECNMYHSGAEVKVAYRVYDPEGDKEDDQGCYKGWHKRFDEWLPVSSARIAKVNTMAGKKTAQYNPTGEELIDDSEDPEDSELFVVLRPGKCRSRFLIDNVNKFGALEGFEKILARLQSKDNLASLVVVSHLTDFVLKLYALFMRPFAREFVPRIKEALWENLLSAPESHVRNFSKERIDAVLLSLELLLKRAYTLQERNELCDKLHLDISLKCFRSPFLERKIQGVKMIMDIVKTVRYRNARWYTTDYIVKWVSENRFLDSLLAAGSHVQIVQRSTEMLKFFASEKKLDTHSLDLLWAATQKGDEDMKLTIYKLLADLTLHLSSDHLEHLVNQLEQIPPHQFIAEEIELLHELARYSFRGGHHAVKTSTFLWKIITDQDQYPNPIVELALTKLTEILRFYDLKGERLPVMMKCVDNLKEGIAVPQALQVLKKVINLYPPQTADTFTKSSAIELLVKEHSLLGILFEDLRKYKTKITSHIEELRNAETVNGPTKAAAVSVDDLVICDRTNHLDQIKERLDFLYFIVSNSSSRLSRSDIDVLWDNIYVNALTVNEKERLLIWLKEMSDNTSNTRLIFEDGVAEYLFTQKIADASTDFSHFTHDGFKCFQNYFLLINERKGCVQQTSKQSSSSGGYSNSYSGYSSYSSYSNYSYSYVPNSHTTSNEPVEFHLLKLPDQLEGLTSLWQVALKAVDDNVVAESIDLLNKCYQNLSPDLQKDIGHVRVEYIETCMKYLEQTVESQLPDTAILRCLSLIESLLEESERRGTGGLKSHSARLKGRLLTVHVQNNMTVGDLPKKFDLSFYSNVTVWDVKCQVAKQAKCSADLIRMIRSGKEIKDKDNSKTLVELKFKNGETVMVSKRTANQQRVALLTSEGQLIPQAAKIFLEWFHRFAKDGKMDRQGIADFIHSCTGDACKATDQRVSTCFSRHDSGAKNYLVEDDFLEFYKSACRERVEVVWSNLYTHGYRHDLKRTDDDEGESEDVDQTTLPRFILTQNQKYFELLFRLLDCGGQITTTIWTLLMRLPTNPVIFNSLLTLDVVKSPEPQWDLLLDSSSVFRLLYSAQIIESLVEEHELLHPTADLPEEDREKAESRANWRERFLLHGGFQHLYDILIKSPEDKQTDALSLFSSHGVSSGLGSLHKSCLALVLKIVRVFILAALSADQPALYNVVQLVRQKSQSSETLSHDPLPSPPSLSSPLPSPVFSSAPSNLLHRNDSTDSISQSKDFKALVRQMSFKMCSIVTSHVDANRLQNRLMNLISTTVDHSVTSEDTQIIENALGLWIGMVLHDHKLLEQFFNRREDTVLKGLFCAEEAQIRKEFTHAIYQICLNVVDVEPLPHVYFENLLLNTIPTPNMTEKRECDQFFDLLCRLVEDSCDGRAGSEASKFESLLVDLAERVKAHPFVEKRNSPEQDKLLIGLMKLIRTLVVKEPRFCAVAGAWNQGGLVDELWNNCLFATPLAAADVDESLMPGPPKCKTRESRGAAFALLSALVKDSDLNLEEIVYKGLLPLQEKIAKVSSWDYSPSSDVKASSGFVGLRNLGCICYMNSMLQQFFMVPTLRYGILTVEDNEPDKSESLLYQLQVMFGHLEMSERQDYNPLGLCQAFKDQSGNPINVAIQQDAQEFLNLIFDRLETRLKGTPQQDLLQQLFGGTTCNQLICKGGCGTVRERNEDFYNISIEVKNQKSVYEGLTKFVSGELLSDYYCETCARQVETVKRSCLNKLPNILIIHCQRIVFNFDTFMNEKINTRYEFPRQLDLEPYTKDGLARREAQEEANKSKPAEDSENNVHAQNEFQAPPSSDERQSADNGAIPSQPHENCEYELVGVVVHDGTADSGHYYSFIRDRNPLGDKRKRSVVFNVNGDENEEDMDDRWFEFNDSTVRPFDIKNLEEECFGGTVEVSETDSYGTTKMKKEQTKNAYMLVYERVKPRSSTDDAAVAAEQAGKQLVKKQLNEKVVPPKIFQGVWEDNNEFLFERQIYHADFFRFLADVVQSVDIEPCLSYDEDLPLMPRVTPQHSSLVLEDVDGLESELQDLTLDGSLQSPPWSCSSTPVGLVVLQVASRFALDVIARAHDNVVLPEFMASVKYLYGKHIPACKSFLLDILGNMNTISDLLLLCPDKVVRTTVEGLLEHLLRTVGPYEHDFLMEEEEVEEMIAWKDERATSDGNQPKTRTVIRPRALTARLMDELISLMDEAAKNWLRFQQYFQVFEDYAAAGAPEAQYLHSRRMIARLIDFFLGERSPLPSENKKRVAMGNKLMSPPFDPLFSCLSTLVRHCETLVSEYSVFPPTALSNPLATLSEYDRRCVLETFFYERVLKEGHNPTAFSLLTSHWSWEDERFSSNLANIILKGLSETNFEGVKPYYEVLGSFLALDDHLQDARIQWVFGDAYDAAMKDPTTYNTYSYSTNNLGNGSSGLLHLIFKARRRLELYTFASLKHFIDIVEAVPKIELYLAKIPPVQSSDRKYTDWMFTFMKQYVRDSANANSSSYSSVTYRRESGDGTLQKIEKLNQRLDEIIETLGIENSPPPPPPQELVSVSSVDTNNMIMNIKHRSCMSSVALQVLEYTPLTAFQRPARTLTHLHTSDDEATSDIGMAVDTRGAQEDYDGANPTYATAASVPSSSPKSSTYLARNDSVPSTTPFEEDLERNAQTGGGEESSHYGQEDGEEYGYSAYEQHEISKNANIKYHPGSQMLKFQVSNDSHSTMQVELFVTPLDDDTNFECPDRSICQDVDSECVTVILTLRKINPNRDWGRFSFEWKTKAIQNSPISRYEPYSDEEDGNPALIGAALPPLPLSSNVATSSNELVPCPICTFDNPPGSKMCDVCGQWLE